MRAGFMDWLHRHLRNPFEPPAHRRKVHAQMRRDLVEPIAMLLFTPEQLLYRRLLLGRPDDYSERPTVFIRAGASHKL